MTMGAVGGQRARHVRRHAGATQEVLDDAAAVGHGPAVRGLGGRAGRAGACVQEHLDFTITGRSMFALLWAVVVLSIAAVLIMLWLLQRRAASQVTSLFFLTPALSAVEGAILFGERLGRAGPRRVGDFVARCRLCRPARRYNVRRQPGGQRGRLRSGEEVAMTDTVERPSGREAETDLARRRPVRRRFRRWHAADRRSVHVGQRAVRQRPVDAAGLSGRDPCPSGHRQRCVRASRCTSPTTTSPRRATRPSVLVAMNPAALKADLSRLEQNGLLIVNSDAFERARPGQGRLRDQPAARRLARRLPRRRGADDLAHAEGHRAARREAARRRALEELLRPRAGLLAVLAADRADARLDREQVQGRSSGAATRRVQRRLQLR